jgi:hypothetical protein
LRRKGFEKRTSKDAWKEVEKVSDMLNQGPETRLHERVYMTKKKCRGMLEKYRDLSRIRNWSRRFTPFLEELLVVGNQTRLRRRMLEACGARRYTLYTDPRRQQKQSRWCYPSRKRMFEEL